MGHPESLANTQELATLNGSISESCVSAKPNQSLSQDKLSLVLRAYSLLCLTVASYSLIQGNVFAPIFAIINIWCVCKLMVLAQRGLDREERVIVQRDKLLIEQRRGSRIASTELDLDSVKFERTLGQRCAGVVKTPELELRLGAFLNEEQRKTFAAAVAALIDGARNRAIEARMAKISWSV